MNLSQMIEALAPPKLKGKTVDPDAALIELRQISREMNAPNALSKSEARNKFERALELFEGLDNWLSNGGFKPKAWK